MIFLADNVLLETELKPDHIKPRLLGEFTLSSRIKLVQSSDQAPKVTGERAPALSWCGRTSTCSSATMIST